MNRNAWLRTIAQVTHLLETWTGEEEGLRTRSQSLDEALTRAEQELELALEKRGDAKSVIEAATKLQEEQRLKVRELEQRIEEVRARRDTVRSEIEEMRVEQAGARQEREHLDNEFRTAFGRDLPTPERPLLDQESAIEAADSEPTLDELEQELEHAKAALDRIGPVNVLAAHEFAEQEERYSFLTEQRADVNESVKSLRTTIKEINETSTDRYLSTFVEVNERFSKTFVELFRGGEAAMRIMDDEDPLESGIEIIARPPGKRPQNIQPALGRARRRSPPLHSCLLYSRPNRRRSAFSTRSTRRLTTPTWCVS